MVVISGPRSRSPTPPGAGTDALLLLLLLLFLLLLLLSLVNINCLVHVPKAEVLRRAAPLRYWVASALAFGHLSLFLGIRSWFLFLGGAGGNRTPQGSRETLPADHLSRRQFRSLSGCVSLVARAATGHRAGE